MRPVRAGLSWLADAGQRLRQTAESEISALAGLRERSAQVGELGGFPVAVTVTRSLGATRVALRDAPGTSVEFAASDLRTADPAGLVTRLEHRLQALDECKASVIAEIENARGKITHARSSVGQRFPKAAELAAAQDRARQINEALERMAAPERGSCGADTGDAPQSPEAGTGKQKAAATRASTGSGGLRNQAILLALLGGAAGVGAGALATAIYANAKGWSIVVPPQAWAGGLAAAVVIGAAAGLFPAIKAARMSPTQALWSL